MDFCFGTWRAASRPARDHGGGQPAAPPLSFSYLNRPSTPHRRRDRNSTSSAEQAYLIPKPHHRRRQRSSDMPGPGSADQETLIDWTKSNKSYRITISNRELKWEHLYKYLGLEFEGLKIPKEQIKTLNEKYVLTLPRKLTAKQLQDIDLLRGNDEDAESFLADLEEEKAS